MSVDFIGMCLYDLMNDDSDILKNFVQDDDLEAWEKMRSTDKEKGCFCYNNV